MSSASQSPQATSQPASLRVVIVDDHAIFRSAARELLERRGYAVVAEAEDAASALDAVQRWAPDGVLLDVHLGQDDGFDVARRLSEVDPELAVVLISDEDYGRHHPRVRNSGARGFLSKVQLARADSSQFWVQTSAELG